MGSSLFGDLGPGSSSRRRTSLFDDEEEAAADEKDLELSRRADLLRSYSPAFRQAMAAAPPPRPEHGPLRTAWDYASSPLKALAGLTGTLSAQLVRPFAPSAYEAAAKELEEENAGYGPELTKPLENLPGLGDVAAQGISKEGITGALIRPVTRIGLNILGDPTSYFGAGILSRIPKVSRFAQEIGAAQRGVEALTKAGKLDEAAELGARIPGIAERLAAATEAETAIGRSARRLVETGEELGQAGATGRALREALQAPSFAAAVRGAGRAGASLPFGPLPGIAYAPELAESIAGQTGQTIEDVRAGKYAEAAAHGAGAMLTAGLGRMVVRGTLDEFRAAKILEGHLAQQLGERPKPEPVELPEPGAGAEPATARAPEVPEEVTPAPTPALTPTPEVTPIPVAEALPGVPPPTPARVEPEPLTSPVPEPAPAPAQPPPPQPLPGSEKIKVERSDINLKKLTDLVEARSEAGKHLTKSDLVDAGLVSERQAKTYTLEALVDALGGTSFKDRLEFKKGFGFLVHPGKKPAATAAGEPAEITPPPTPAPAVETPPAVSPEASAAARKEAEARVGLEQSIREAQAEGQRMTEPTADQIAQAELEAVGVEAEKPRTPSTSPTPVTRQEIDRQLSENPELGQLAETSLREVASGAGKKFEDLTKEDVRLAFPGEENKQSRATLNRVLYAIQKRDRMLAEEAAKKAEVGEVGEAGKAAETAPKTAVPVETAAGELRTQAPAAPTASQPTPGMAAAARELEGELAGGGGSTGRKPTPDRVLRIGRGAHGQVKVVFPDKLHADLFSAPGRSRGRIRGEERLDPGWDYLARQFNTDRAGIGDLARKYREQVQSSIKGLEEDAEFQAPRAIEQRAGTNTKAKPIPEKPPTPESAATAVPVSAPAPVPAHQDRFARAFARLTGSNDPGAVLKQALESPAPAAGTSSVRPSPFARTLDRIRGLSDSQRSQLSDAFQMREALAGRSKQPVTFDSLDPDLRANLRLKSPDDLADFSKRTGIKDPADFALLHSVSETFDKDIDDARSAYVAAQKSGSADLEDAAGRLAFAGLRKAAVLDSIIPDLGRC